MPFITRTQVTPPTVNPRPRIRPVPVSVPNIKPAVTEDVSELAEDVKATPKAPARVKKASRKKRQPTGDYLEGYCRTPVRTRFKAKNPGGPGRPKKDSKSQDDLMRAELLKLQQVTEGGRRRRVTTRELLPQLIIKTALQKLNTKELRALNDEGRRLFPDRAADTAAMIPTDPAVERDYLRKMIAAIGIGEPAEDDADPLADFITSVFDANDEDDDMALGGEDPDVIHKEQSDEAA